MKAQLEELAKETQKSVITILRRNSPSITFKSFWINNKIFVKNASPELIQLIADIPNVKDIREEKVLHIHVFNKNQFVPVNRKQERVEWGIAKIQADLAWGIDGGNRGEGIIVATIDTGVRGTHEALRSNHRSLYGWFDPVARTRNPVDVAGHGTHTMGTLAGSHGIGVAPGAEWVSCRGCRADECLESTLTECDQWILCPTLWNTLEPDCSKTPHLVSNSWGGGTSDDFYTAVVNAWRAAGIIPLFSQGNWDSTCGKASSPGDYETVIAVGATTSADRLFSSSRRGPTVDGRLKPEVVAPGVNIISSCFQNDTAYCSETGTSMACPHAAGTVALLLAKNPELTFDQVKGLLQNYTDTDLMDMQEFCGGTNSTEFPNNTYGYGRINARKSFLALINSLL